jgi:hypothetical protein
MEVSARLTSQQLTVLSLVVGSGDMGRDVGRCKKGRCFSLCVPGRAFLNPVPPGLGYNGGAGFKVEAEEGGTKKNLGEGS